ncbi:MAG: SDR family oxidoreductase [Verrucomicrobiota bacterium]
MTQNISILGKTALVTGANRGIGKAIVETFLENGAQKVYAAVRDLSSAQPLLEKYGDRVTAIEVDLSKPDSIERAADVATDVDIVVNNAGILKAADPLMPSAIDTLKDELDVNVFGLIYVAQAFAPVLKANGGGVLVQLNSVASLKNFSDFATYSASKAASYSITQGLREKLAQQGTHVLSVHPGPIGTDMAKDAGIEDIAEPPSVVSEGIVKALAAGNFHLFPDTMAKQFEAVYAAFAENIVEANLAEA